MKTKLLIAILIISTLCFGQLDNKLLVQKIAVNLDAKPQMKKGAVEVMTSDYFEIELQLLAKVNEYIASKDVEYVSASNSTSIHICDKSGEHIKFKNTMDFLNYMSARGYEMMTRKELRFGYDYTFKRRK